MQRSSEIDWKVRALQAEDRVAFLEMELAKWKKKATAVSAQLGFLSSEGSGTFSAVNRRGSASSPVSLILPYGRK